MTSLELLDRHYASQLGCAPEDLNSDRLTVVPNETIGGVRFAKGIPLAVYALSKSRGAVISVLPSVVEPARVAVADRAPSGLDDDLCDTLQSALNPVIDVRFWFRGYRLYCSGETFTDRTVGEVREVTTDDQIAAGLNRKWGGPVFGQIADGRVVSWAAIKALSDVAWDLSVETRPEYRGRGYAKSAVSAAVRHILGSGKLATWGCDRDNPASLSIALSVGFEHYALDFGCEERSVS
jgi:GNAT superfamily N-acetyltransferase